MAARRYEISLRVLKKYFTSERSEQVKYFSNHNFLCSLFQKLRFEIDVYKLTVSCMYQS